MKQDDSIIIIPADKGNKTVILDKATYLDKLWERIKNSKINSDPTAKTGKNSKLCDRQNIQNHPSISTETIPSDSELVLPCSSLHQYKAKFSPAPLLHGLMKQKENNPLREISDASHFPGHFLAKTLHKLFKNYTGKTSMYIKNGKDLIDVLKASRFQKGGIYISCDTDKLLPSIIVLEGPQILEKKMR